MISVVTVIAEVWSFCCCHQWYRVWSPDHSAQAPGNNRRRARCIPPENHSNLHQLVKKTPPKRFSKITVSISTNSQKSLSNIALHLIWLVGSAFVRVICAKKIPSTWWFLIVFGFFWGMVRSHLKRRHGDGEAKVVLLHRHLGRRHNHRYHHRSPSLSLSRQGCAAKVVLLYHDLHHLCDVNYPDTLLLHKVDHVWSKHCLKI